MTKLFLITLLFSKIALASGTPMQIEMRSISYFPKKLELTVGQAVVWKNVSYTKHSATGDSFDTGMIAPKASSKEVVFAQPGDYIYHCSMHGKTMSGEIVVKAAKP